MATIWRTLALEQGRDPRCRVLLHRGDCVAVGVERDRDRCVPEPLLDDLRMHAGLERERRVGVPQVVQPDLRQPGVAHVVVERSRERPRLDRRPVLAAEDEIVRLIRFAPVEPLPAWRQR